MLLCFLCSLQWEMLASEYHCKQLCVLSLGLVSRISLDSCCMETILGKEELMEQKESSAG